MSIPNYNLSLSRHNIYYLRITFPDRKEIKRSLGTTSSRDAILQAAELINQVTPTMSYREQKERIAKVVEANKQRILDEGVFDERTIQALKNSIALGSDPVEAEINKQIIELNKQACAFELEVDPQQSNSTHVAAPKAKQSPLLSVVIEDFYNIKTNDGSWTHKTAIEAKGIYSTALGIIGDLPVNDIRRVQAEAYKAKLLDQELAPASINKRVTKLSGLFSWLVMHEHTDLNPFINLHTKDSRKQSEQRKAFTEADTKRIIKAALPLDDFHKWIPLILLHSGMRIGEASQLHTEDIKQVNGTWVFDVNSDGVKRLKTTASRRLIPIHQYLINQGLLDWHKSREGEQMLFSLTHGRDGFGRRASTSFTRILTKLGITDPLLSPYSSRHTFITRLAHSQGIEDRIIQALVGHSTGTITFDVYTKEYPVQDLLSAVNSVSW